MSREATGHLTFPDRAAAQRFVDSTMIFAGKVVPPFDGALQVRRTPVVFVAHKT